MATRKQIERALQRLENAAARALLEDVGRTLSRANLARLTDSLERGDVEAAIRAAGIRDGGFNRTTEAIRNAYVEGGETFADDVPARFGFTFDMNNPRAVEWLATQSSTLVTRINESQREAIRTVLAAGADAGQNPRRTALDIIGRFDRQKGRRVGAIVGLNDSQARTVMRARAALRSGDTTQMRRYLQLKRRDRRFDGIVRRAIESGQAVSVADAERLTGRLADRLLQTRGEAIARTETAESFHRARRDGLIQAVDEGIVRPENIEREWVTAGDERVRNMHVALNGQRVTGIDTPFVDPVTGDRLLHPLDRSLGASAANLVMCRCSERRRVSFINQEL